MVVYTLICISGSQASSSPLCVKGKSLFCVVLSIFTGQAGIGVGICIGAITICLLFGIGIITIKMHLKHKDSLSAPTQHVAMKQNKAYELHKPQRGHPHQNSAL